jgi:hypothetical protein
MEITSFVLGMLTIVAVILLTVIVVGIVKISKLEKEKNSLHQLIASVEGDLRKGIDNIHHIMSHENESIRRIIEDTNRDIAMVEKTIMNQINKADEGYNKREVELHRLLHQEIEDLKSYTDSRVDKALGAIGTKQVLKG